MHLEEIDDCYRKGGRCIVMGFDGLSEQVAAVRAAYATGKPTSIDLLHYLGQSEWIGRDVRPRSTREEGLSSIERLLNQPWKEGTDVVRAMADKLAGSIPEPRSIRRQPAWNDDEGDFCLDRAERGDPCFRNAVRRRTNSFRVVTLLCQVNGSCFMSPQTMFWRGAVAVALCDLLEQAGYGVEFVTYAYARQVYGYSSNPSVMSYPDHKTPTGFTYVTVKTADQPLDLQAVANGSSAWIFRSLTFATYDVPFILRCRGLTRRDITPAVGLGMPTYVTHESPIIRRVFPDACASPNTFSVTDAFDEKTALSLARDVVKKIDETSDHGTARGVFLGDYAARA